MRDKNTTESTFFQLLGPILSRDLWQKISKKVASMDRYAKKLKTVQLVQLMMNAEMQQYSSLDEISNSLKEEAFAQALHLESISTSQVSRRFREMSTEVADIVHKSVVQTLGVECGFNALRQTLGRLYLIDASTISLCLSQYLWADFRGTKAGVKFHQRIRFEGDAIPDEATITVARKSDKSQLESLIVEDEDALKEHVPGGLQVGKVTRSHPGLPVILIPSRTCPGRSTRPRLESSLGIENAGSGRFVAPDGLVEWFVGGQRCPFG